MNLGFFAAIAFMAALTMFYLASLNRKHGLRRAALGKSARVVDLSLETAAEAERMERLQQEAQSESAPNGRGNGHGNGKDDKAFLDATDRENEDFVYVY